MKRNLIIALVVIVAVIFLMFSWVTENYNKIVTLKENIDAKWAQVENQLKRRNDLIPNLVNTVKGYAKHEKEIFTGIAEARSKLAGAGTISDKIKASNELGGFLSRLLMVVERYPDLKANQNFSQLMHELSGTENRISVERMRYNNVVRDYNMTIKRFPGRLFALIFGFTKATYFEIEEAEKKAPKVEF
ncbi:MAG: LemA family protein [bacterium]|nr:LemA family protein [bacterium]